MTNTKLDTYIRDGLRTIADQLAHHNPSHLMLASHRHSLALQYADKTHPTDEDAAVELERQILRRMPFVDGRAVTRGEYALWLHRNAWGA